VSGSRRGTHSTPHVRHRSNSAQRPDNMRSKPRDVSGRFSGRAVSNRSSSTDPCSVAALDRLPCVLCRARRPVRGLPHWRPARRVGRRHQRDRDTRRACSGQDDPPHSVQEPIGVAKAMNELRQRPVCGRVPDLADRRHRQRVSYPVGEVVHALLRPLGCSLSRPRRSLSARVAHSEDFQEDGRWCLLASPGARSPCRSDLCHAAHAQVAGPRPSPS
jgi:hypothetical protein